MAMVAGAVANGGVEMTPHLMEQIRDSQGDLVEAYKPKPWLRPISPQTAATLTTFMKGVVTSGTADKVGFPASWDVAAKTGTAQTGSFGPDPLYTDDWLIAFAPVGNTKVAIAVVLPREPGSATGAAYSGPIVKQILGDVLADQG
jgi:peptidoglycan glycosyltransferase